MKLRRPMNNALSESYSRSTITLYYSQRRHLCCVSTDLYVFSQVELCWILPSMVRLVTPTRWSTRSVTVLGFTMCSEVYPRSNPAMMHVWRLSRRWRLEICVRTPTPPQNTKAAMILSRATKPAAVGISHTHRSITTWVMQVRLSVHMCFAAHLGSCYSSTSRMHRNWHMKVTVEEFVGSVRILRQVWNLAGTFHVENTSFYVVPFVQKFNFLHFRLKWKKEIWLNRWFIILIWLDLIAAFHSCNVSN